MKKIAPQICRGLLSPLLLSNHHTEKIFPGRPGESKSNLENEAATEMVGSDWAHDSRAPNDGIDNCRSILRNMPEHNESFSFQDTGKIGFVALMILRKGTETLLTVMSVLMLCALNNRRQPFSYQKKMVDF